MREQLLPDEDARRVVRLGIRGPQFELLAVPLQRVVEMVRPPGVDLDQPLQRLAVVLVLGQPRLEHLGEIFEPSDLEQRLHVQRLAARVVGLQLLQPLERVERALHRFLVGGVLRPG
jgi:hypothetical protein